MASRSAAPCSCGLVPKCKSGQAYALVRGALRYERHDRDHCTRHTYLGQQTYNPLHRRRTEPRRLLFERLDTRNR